MALINCPECGAQVSDAALACPNCGHPMPKHAARRKTLQTFTVGWMSLVVILLIVALFALLGTCNWKPV